MLRALSLLMLRALSLLGVAHALAPAPYETLRAARVVDPVSGATTSVLEPGHGPTLVAVVPQLGEFDSCEFCEFLAAAHGDLAAAGSLSALRPPDDAAHLRAAGDAWLNYLLMCAGVGAPGTLPEILRGYFGDASAPERLAPDAVVEAAGFITIGPGVGPVKLGPFAYENSWKDEAGYQRPVELATVGSATWSRSRQLGRVSDSRFVDRRGATFLFDTDGATLYEYEHRGVLTYSATMARPLSFFAPYIGAALNPLGLGDNGLAKAPH
ncbi:AhpC/TSA antioxidant enzyme [Aureococcus anophagefferens]|nr:AhpC/TSA antioxidant enzyme [Aureococcus anophagefferens]